jgi:hypothetical protein
MLNYLKVKDPSQGKGCGVRECMLCGRESSYIIGSHMCTLHSPMIVVNLTFLCGSGKLNF